MRAATRSGSARRSWSPRRRRPRWWRRRRPTRTRSSAPTCTSRAAAPFRGWATPAGRCDFVSEQTHAQKGSCTIPASLRLTSRVGTCPCMHPTLETPRSQLAASFAAVLGSAKCSTLLPSALPNTAHGGACSTVQQQLTALIRSHRRSGTRTASEVSTAAAPQTCFGRRRRRR